MLDYGSFSEKVAEEGREVNLLTFRLVFVVVFLLTAY
jgi:hypothetical protein